MKKLLLLVTLLTGLIGFAQPNISGISYGVPTHNSLFVSYITSTPCTANYEAQISSSASFSPFTTYFSFSQGSNQGSVPRTLTFSGLLPNTTYYVRFYGITPICQGQSITTPIHTFTTASSSAPGFADVSSSAVTFNAATINYNIIANNALTTTVVNYGLSAAALTSQVVGSSANNNDGIGTAVSKNLIGLTPNTTYFYQIVGTNASGTGSAPVQSFTTGILPVPLLTNVTTTASNLTNASLSYTLNTRNESTSTVINYGLSATALTSQLPAVVTPASTLANNLTASLTGLLPFTTYFYQIVSTNIHATVSSTVQSFTTNAAIIAKYSFTGLTNANLDESGNNLTLTSSTGTTSATGIDGLAQNSVVFDGASQRSSNSALFNPNSITIAAWINKTSQQPFSTIAGKRFNNTSAPFNTYFFSSGSNVSGKLTFSFTTSNYNDLTITSNATLDFNKWYHVAVTYDSKTGIAKLFIDGILDKMQDFEPNAAVVQNLKYNPVTSQDYFIGRINGLGNHGHVGRIDEMFVFGSPLSDADVLYIKNLNPAPIDLPVVSLVSSSSVTSNSVVINYSVNATNAATTTVIKYGTDPLALTSQVSGSNANGGTTTAFTTPIAGLLANTTYYFQLEVTNSVGTVYSNQFSFTTVAVLPIISNVAFVTASASSQTINYTLNASGFATTSLVKYGTSAANLNLQVVGSSASGTANTNGTAILPNLTQGTEYFFQVEATNANGTVNSAVLSFIKAGDAIAEYSFNNNYNNVLGNVPFVAGANNSFVADRAGIANNALRINFGSATASISNLPTGNAVRSVSVWVKAPLSTDLHVFKYGNLTTNAVYGLSLQSSNIVNFGFANDMSATGTFVANQWMHIVTTFDGTTARIYKNGTQIASSNRAGWNTANTIFTIGGSGDLNIDDLKIYNRVLNTDEITSLFNNNAILSSNDFNTKNLKASIYPNPTRSSFTIDIEKEIKSVEIYSIQGQRVMTANNKNINVANLSKGIYLVRVEDENNAIATQKLVIE